MRNMEPYSRARSYHISEKLGRRLEINLEDAVPGK